jgi:hypothetical protein
MNRSMEVGSMKPVENNNRKVQVQKRVEFMIGEEKEETGIVRRQVQHQVDDKSFYNNKFLNVLLRHPKVFKLHTFTNFRKEVLRNKELQAEEALKVIQLHRAEERKPKALRKNEATKALIEKMEDLEKEINILDKEQMTLLRKGPLRKRQSCGSSHKTRQKEKTLTSRTDLGESVRGLHAQTTRNHLEEGIFKVVMMMKRQKELENSSSVSN